MQSLPRELSTLVDPMTREQLADQLQAIDQKLTQVMHLLGAAQTTEQDADRQWLATAGASCEQANALWAEFQASLAKRDCVWAMRDLAASGEAEVMAIVDQINDRLYQLACEIAELTATDTITLHLKALAIREFCDDIVHRLASGLAAAVLTRPLAG
jgi:hypothetical protein